MSTRRYATIVFLLILLMLTSAFSGALVFAQGAAVPLSQSGGAVCVNLATPAVTLYGIGSAPACPALWTELVGQTSAGTFAPVTAVTTTTINPITSISQVGISTLTSMNTTALNVQTGAGGQLEWCANNVGCAGGAAGTRAVAGTGNATGYTVAQGGSATGYTVANGATTTTYTWYYRICQAP